MQTHVVQVSPVLNNRSYYYLEKCMLKQSTEVRKKNSQH